ncbi:hypothetical protein DFH09DRAFT_1399330 [Mycena vulgaris]|nr:hypothetical protein DFH09DRAFT_1399330 [Mycena vulgaris]
MYVPYVRSENNGFDAKEHGECTPGLRGAALRFRIRASRMWRTRTRSARAPSFGGDSVPACARAVHLLPSWYSMVWRTPSKRRCSTASKRRWGMPNKKRWRMAGTSADDRDAELAPPLLGYDSEQAGEVDADDAAVYNVCARAPALLEAYGPAAPLCPRPLCPCPVRGRRRRSLVERPRLLDEERVPGCSPAAAALPAMETLRKEREGPEGTGTASMSTRACSTRSARLRRARRRACVCGAAALTIRGWWGGERLLDAVDFEAGGL